jgi:PST family polysaccharide transporter
MSLLRTGVQALKWSLLGELAARVLGPLTFIVLARLLVPEDFGIVAAATVLTSLCQVICDFGMSKALVQRNERVDEAATAAFWITLALGFVATLLLLAAAGAVAGFFREPRIEAVLQVLSPLPLLTAAASVPAAIMQRQLRFRPMFWARTVGSLVPAALGVPMAMAGAGVWALVAGTLGGQVLQLVLLWGACGWRPTGRLDRGIARELLGFSGWVLLANLALWGYGWLDAVVVGRWLSTHDMGLYRTGSTLVTMVFGVVFSPLMPVLYSVFARSQHDLPLLRDALMAVVRLAAVVAIPMALLLYALRDVLAAQLLGERWSAAGPVIGAMALTVGASWLVTFNGELLRAMGRPRAEVLLLGPLLAVYVLVYLFAVRRGLDAFLLCRLALALMSIAVHVAVCRTVAHLAARRWQRPLGALACGLASAVVVTAAHRYGGAALGLTLGVMATVLLAAGLLWLERGMIADLWSRWRAGAPPANLMPS